MRVKKPKKYINLKETARISGYSSDYIGWLIRKGKVKGKKVYTNISWQIPQKEVIKYCKKMKNLEIRDSFLLKKKYLSLKEAAEISGYTSDYIGYLIRKGKLKGKEIYTGISWLTTEEAIREYQKSKIKTKKEKKKILADSKKLIYDILPSEKIKEVSKEIAGFKSYKTKVAKLFGIGWRLGFVTIILFLLIGIGPIEIFQRLVGAFTEEEKTINFYSTLCNGNWQNPQNVQGQPDVGPDGNINSFSEANSAVYKGGPLSLTCQKFAFSDELDTEIPGLIEQQEISDQQLPGFEPFQEESLLEGNLEEEQGGDESGIGEQTEGLNEAGSQPEEETQLEGEETGEIQTEETQEEQEEQNLEEVSEEEQQDVEEQQEEIQQQEEQETSNTEQEESPVINEEENLEEPAQQEAEESPTQSPPPETNNSENEPISFFQKVKRFFGGLTAEAQQTPTFEELSETQFSSAKIKISFAIGEKEPDILPIEEQALPSFEEQNLGGQEIIEEEPPEQFIEEEQQEEEQPEEEESFEQQEASDQEIEEVSEEEQPEELPEMTPIETSTPPISFWKRVKNLFGTLVVEAQENIPSVETTTPGTSETILGESDTSLQDDLSGSNIPAIDTPTFSGESPIEILPNIDAKIIIWYSLDGELWWQLDTISSYPLSNALNGDYFSYDAPFLEDWEDVKNLQIKLEGVIGGETSFAVYLDSVWVETSYAEEGEGTSKIKYISKKKGFKANEEIEFRFRYKKIDFGLLASVGEVLGIVDHWDNINVTAQIINPKGEILEISPDFIFENNGEFLLKFKKPKGFKPGLYRIILRIEDNSTGSLQVEEFEQDFTFGVLAINVNKSIYLSDEQAYIQMAALRDDGHTICEANLKLEIISPRGEIFTPEVQKSGKCGPNNVINVPDYFAYYQVGKTGSYQMKLTNLDNGYEITDSFEVRGSVPFDVERIGPTRIWPYSAYELKFKIKANQDFEGQVIESVPAGFDIQSSVSNFKFQAFSGDKKQEEKNIIWNIDWKKGETYEISYQFDAPDLSPYLYLLGPLRFEEKNPIDQVIEKTKEVITELFEDILQTEETENTNVSGNDSLEVFSEARQWQVAADALDIVRPNGDVTTDFANCTGAGCGTGHYAVLDEAIYDSADYVNTGTSGSGDEVEEFNMTLVAGALAEVTQADVKFQAHSNGGCNDTCDDLEVRIFIDGGYETATTVTLTGSDTLHTAAFSGTWTGDDDLRVEFTRKVQGTPTATSSTIRPDGDSTPLECTPTPSGVHWDTVSGESDNVNEPTAGDTTDYVTCGGGLEDSFTMDNSITDADEVTSVQVWVYVVSSKSNRALDVELLYSGGSTGENIITGIGTSYGWYSTTFSSLTLTQAQLTSLVVRFENGLGTTMTVATMYADVTYNLLGDTIDDDARISQVYAELTFVPPPEEITLEGYTFENDDEDQSTGDAVDENTVQAGSSFSSGKTISDVKKGERLTVRTHINNTGGGLYSNLALFYDRNDKIWTKVEDRPLAGSWGLSCGGGASSDFGCTTAFDGGDTTDGQYTSIAFDPSGNAWVSLRDYTQGDTIIAKYVGSGGSGCGGSITDWDCTIAFDGTDVNDGTYTSIAFDPSGNAWVSLWDSVQGDTIVARIFRGGEIQTSPGLAGANGDSIQESHADMTSYDDDTNRNDIDCLTGGANWNNGKWFESEEGSDITLPAGTTTTQCTEIAFVIDTSQATASTTYRFVLATKDNWRTDKGPWRGPISVSANAYPTLTIESSTTERFAKDNQPKFLNSNCGAGAGSEYGCSTAFDGGNDNDGAFTSIAFDPSGTAWVSLQDQTQGDTIVAKYVGSGGSNCGGTITDWDCTIAFDGVDSGAGAWTSIAFDPSGNAWVSLQDYAAAGGSDTIVAKYVGSGGANCGGSVTDWDCTIAFDGGGASDGSYTSIAFDPSGNAWVSLWDPAINDGHTVVAKYVGSGGSNCGAGASAAWDCTIAFNGADSDDGSYTSIAFDPSGNAWVSFYDYYLTGGSHTVVAKYVGSGGSGCGVGASTDWDCTTAFDGGGTSDGRHTSIAFDPSGNAWVSLQDNVQGETIVAKYTGVGDETSCGTFAVDWDCTIAFDGGDNVDGRYTSIAFDPSGSAWVSLHDETQGDTIVARYVGSGGSGCGGTIADWDCTIAFDGADANDGATTSIAFDPSGNAWVSLWDPAINDGHAVVAKLHLPPGPLSALTKTTQDGRHNTGSGDARYLLDRGKAPATESGTCSATANNEGYCGTAADDTDYDSITALINERPMFTFATRHTSSTDIPTATWIGQSTVAPSSKAITMEVYRFGTTDAWETLSLDTNTCSSAGADTDCTLSGDITASQSEYYEQDGSNYWIYFRVWQTENTASENLKTDSFGVSFAFIGNEKITLEGYTFENDDEDQSTGDAVDENTVQAGSSFSSGKTISNVKKGERLTVRAHIKNTGGELDSNLALFYDRNDKIWTKVEDRPLAGTWGSSCGAGASSDFGCTTVFDGSNFDGSFTSIAFDSSGNAWVSLHDYNPGDTIVAKYVGSGGSGCGGSITDWDCTIAFDGGNDDDGKFTSIAFDPSGTAWVSLTDYSQGDTIVAKYVGSGGANCGAGASAAWDCTTAFDGGNTDDGKFTSIAFDPSGTAWVSLTDYSQGDTIVAKYVGSGGSNCGGSITDWDCTIAFDGGITLDGRYTSIAFDPSGTAWVSLTDYSQDDTIVAKYVGSGGSNCGGSITDWNCTIAFDGGAGDGKFTSIAFDPSGNAWVSLYDYASADGHAVVARYVGSGGSNCGAGASSAWDCTIAFDGGDDNDGQYTSIAFDPSGNAWVSFYDDATNDGHTVVARISRGGEIQTSPGLAGANNDSIQESHADMTSFDDDTNRNDIDCLTGGANWNNGKWFESEEGSDITLPAGNTTAQCTEIAFVIDTSQATASTTYRFVLATKDNWRTDKGLWRGPISVSANAYPTLTIESETSTRFGKDNTPKFADCTDTSWGCLVVDETAGGASDDVGSWPSIAFDPAGNPWVSYYDATNNSLMIAKYVGSGGTGCASAAWNCETVDDPAANVGDYTSLVFDPSGNPWVAYRDNGANALRLAQYVGTGGNGCTNADNPLSWTCLVVDDPTSGADVGYFPSLAFGHGGNPWISYRDFTNTQLKISIFKPGTAASGGCAEDWECSVLENSGDVGNYNSIAFDPQGSAQVAYYNNTSKALSIARFVGSGGTGCTGGTNPDAWACELIDDPSSGATDAGRYTSIVFDASGNARIAYQDITNQSLKIAEYVGTGGSGCENSTNPGTWSCTTVDDPTSGDVVGVYAKLAFDAGGNPWISHSNCTISATCSLEIRLKVARYTLGSAASGGCAANWTCIEVDNPAAYVGRYTSIAFDFSGTPWVAYYDTTNGDLKVTKLHLPPTGLSPLTRTVQNGRNAASGDARYLLDRGKAPATESGTCSATVNNEGYCGTAADDTDYDSITALLNERPMFTFATRHTNNIDTPTATWIGQSTVAPSSKAVTMEVYRFGTTNAWETLSLDTNTCSSTAENIDCTLSGDITANRSEYYEQDGSNYWIYFRVWQTENTASENLKTDSFGASFAPPALDISGTVYLADETTQGTLGNGGPCNNGSPSDELSLRVDGGGAVTTSCSSVDASFTFSSVSVSANQTITIYLTTGQKANRVYVSDGTTDINMDLYIDALAVGDENDDTVTILDLLNYDNDQNATSMLFDADDATPDFLLVDSGIELHIHDGDTFDPGGDVDTQGAAGDAHIDDNATLQLDTATSTITGDVLVDDSATLNVQDNVEINGGDITTTGTSTVTYTTTPTLTMSGEGSIGGGTPSITFYNLTTLGTSTTTIASAITADNNLTIGTGTTIDADSNVTVGGNWSNSGAFTSGTSTVTFNTTSTGKTISGTLDGSSAFNKIVFNGSGSCTRTSAPCWTIEDAIEVTDTSATALDLQNGRLTLGNGTGDNLEVDGGFKIAATADQSAAFDTITTLTGLDSITIDINDSAAPACATNCVVDVGASSGSGQGDFKIARNVTLRFNSSGSVTSGLEAESTGYLEIQGALDDIGTDTDTDTVSYATRETKICATEVTWSTDEHNNKNVRITNATSLAFGKIYAISDTIVNDTDCDIDTDESLTINDTSNPSGINSVNMTVSGSGSTRLICSDSSTLITADNEEIGRYVHDLQGITGYYKIVDSVNNNGSCSSNDSFTVIAEPASNFTSLDADDDFKIVDGIRVDDTFEILDYTIVTAEATNHGYILGKAGSETLIRYADIDQLGVNTNDKYGITFNTVNAATDNEGATVDKSRIHDGYWGIRLTSATNNNFTDNAVYSNSSIGIYLLSNSNNNTFSSNALYSNATYGIYLSGSSNNTLSSNISYNNSLYGIYLFSSNNTLSSNISYGNANLGIYLWSSSNNTLSSNTSYGNPYGIYLAFSSNNNTLSSNTVYSNAIYDGIYLDSSSNNTLSSNTVYSNANIGIYLDSSSNNNTLSSNTVYSNLEGLRIGDSSGTIIINDDYGVSGDNTTADIVFNDSVSASTLDLYNVDLASTTTEVSGVTYTGAYIISEKHDSTATSIKIWGEYTISDVNTETPQSEETQKFNYTDNLWENSMTEASYSGTGSEDTVIDQAFSGAWTSGTTVFGYRITCRDDSAADCDSTATSTNAWDVFREEVDIGDVDKQETFTDSDTGAQFNFDGGTSIATAYATGDTYKFVAWKASNNTNTQKIVAVQKADDKITVGTGETFELKGGGGGANQDSQITHAVAGTWDFDITGGTANVFEATINDIDLVGGTLTVVNTILNNRTVVADTLNVDWYLGIHVVDQTATSTNINTQADAITISEASSATTVWRYSGGWGTPDASKTTDTDATGINPQPNNTGAIRIREYSMTDSTACPGAGCTLYNYNIQIDWVLQGGTNYGPYDYYVDYGGEYITSCLANTSTCDDDGTNSDDVIGSAWNRTTIVNVNGSKPYDGLNEPPDNGTWYMGVFAGLSFSISSLPGGIDFGIINPGAAPTDRTDTLTVTTSATNGYVITTWSTQEMTCSDAGACGSETITDWIGTNATPTAWSAGSYGFGYSTDDTTLIGGTANRFSGDNFAGFVHSGAGDPVADRSNTECPCESQQNTITYRIAASSTQRAGPYQTVVVYIATAQY